MVCDNLRVKITDFGLSKRIENSQEPMSNVGTKGWRAPEQNGTVGGASILPFKTDIYIFGIIGYWLATTKSFDTIDVYFKKLDFEALNKKKIYS